MIPYEEQYKKYLKKNGLADHTITYYCKALSKIMFRLRSLNLVFDMTNDPAKLSVDDLETVFSEFQRDYAYTTFNKFHSVVNGYWRFLLVEVRLHVPPLSWTIETKKLDKKEKYPELNWDYLINMTLENNSFSFSEKAAFLFSAKGLSRTQILHGTRDFGDYISYSNLEKEFIVNLKNSLKDVPAYEKFGVMVLTDKHQRIVTRDLLNKKISKVLSYYGIFEKPGTLITDARIYQTLKNDFEARDIARIYELIPNYHASVNILKEARKRKKQFLENEKS